MPKVLKPQAKKKDGGQKAKNHMRSLPVGEDVRQPVKEGTRKLRIAQVLRAGSQWGSVTPETLAEKGLGGRETAIIKLAEQWAFEGHEVHSFVQVDEPRHYILNTGGRYSFVSQELAPGLLSDFIYDAVIAWECPEVLEGIPDNFPTVKIVGMQVAHINEHDQSVVDVYITLSPWAGDFLSESGSIERDKIQSIPNGIDLNRFVPESNRSRFAKKMFFYSSSPDRGLIHLLHMWPRLRDEVLPGSNLVVAYGARNWTDQVKWTHFAQGEVALDTEILLNQPGVLDVGTIGQHQLAKIQSQAIMLPYTCDTFQPTETGCITVSEAMAACVPVVTTDCDCLGSEYGTAAEIVPLPFDEDVFLGAIDKVLSDQELYKWLQQKGYELARARTWKRTSGSWLELIWNMKSSLGYS